MARLHKNGTLSGLLGDAVLRSYNDTTFVYKRPKKVSNPQSKAQMMQRTKKQNIVNVYGRMKPALKDNFQGKVGKQSDYSMFVSCNLSQQAVFLTQDEVRFGQLQIVAPYVVAFGKMVPIEYTLEEEWLVSNISVGDLEFTDETMVLDLTTAIITCNVDWKAGDILEFISSRQLIGSNAKIEYSIPYVECDYANIELSKVDRTKLKNVLGDIELKVDEGGFLCMKAKDEGGYAMVHKRKGVKDVATGTQNMVVRSSILDSFCSEEHCEEAIQSYIKKK